MYMNELKENLYDYLSKLRGGEKSLPFRSEGGLDYYFVKDSAYGDYESYKKDDPEMPENLFHDLDFGNIVIAEAYDRGVLVLSSDDVHVTDLELDSIREDNMVLISMDERRMTGFEWIVIKASEELGFETELEEGQITVLARDTDGDMTEWFYWDRKSRKFVVNGNTDNLNIWLCETTSLTADELVKYFKTLRVSMREFVGPEDWQEIAGVSDASEDERYYLS